ncbi:MAG: acetoin dehydrogenase [Peptococcaceae bacterium BICA1-7]|nr:MAG: acetoin dehydrogenase [Peptococcaceae bacterium BICA1-7]HBV99523.1 CBS domain-containing protein [Desulfotomaculum sp.]
MFVKDCMSTTPISITPTTPILEALNTMKKNKIRQLPVVENNRLVGLVTERELLTVTPSPATTLSIYEMNYLLAKMVVKEVMVKNPVTVEPSSNIEDAALIMRDKKLGSLLVTENGKLVGIITQTDVFDKLISMFGLRKAGTRLVIETDDRVGALADIVDEVRNLGLNLVGVAIADKSDRKVQIMLRISTADPGPLVKNIKEKGFTVTSIS